MSRDFVINNRDFILIRRRELFNCRYISLTHEFSAELLKVKERKIGFIAIFIEFTEIVSLKYHYIKYYQHSYYIIIYTCFCSLYFLFFSCLSVEIRIIF